MPNEIYAAFDTTEGKFKVKLFADKAPNTVNNFVSLADGSKTGKPFYDGTMFPSRHSGFHDPGRLSLRHRHAADPATNSPTSSTPP